MAIFGDDQPETVRVADRDLKCLVCQGTQFVPRKSLLQTGVFRFLGPNWADQPVTCAICSQCGFIHWFLG